MMISAKDAKAFKAAMLARGFRNLSQPGAAEAAAEILAALNAQR
jgi:hypothetical protein